MATSIIISSNSKEYVEKKLSEIKALNISSTQDLLIIDVEQEKSSIGIIKMLELKKWVNIKPFSGKNKIAIIYHAHLLTTEAQNSILKLLEEPNLSTLVILICNNYQKLLPTIISRCQLFEDLFKTLEDSISTDEFFKLDLLDKFEYIEKFEKSENKKDLIENFLKMLLNYFRDLLLKTKNRSIIEKIKLITDAKKMIDSKVPSKNVLDNLLIQLDL